MGDEPEEPIDPNKQYPAWIHVNGVDIIVRSPDDERHWRREIAEKMKNQQAEDEKERSE